MWRKMYLSLTLFTQQIHSYLSFNWKDMGISTKAKDRRYVPDPNKAGDLGNLREKALLNWYAQAVTRLGGK